MTSQDPGPLAPRRRRALSLLAEGRTTTEVATELGINRSTLWRWQQEPAFAAELSGLQTSTLAAVQSRLAIVANGAVDLLQTAITDPDLAMPVRCRAAIALLDRCGLPRKVEQRLSGDGVGPVRMPNAGEVAQLEADARQAILRPIVHMLTDDQLRELAIAPGDP